MAWTYNALPELSDEEFRDWQLLLEERTGISFERYKMILQTGLGQRMREVGCSDYSEYYRRVRFGKGGALEWAALLRTLTVKETRFIRDPCALEHVRKYLMSILSDAERQAPIEVWSVASSTGEEPYTLAMLVNDCIESSDRNDFFGVTATDICAASLSEARKGVYSQRRVSELSTETINKYFQTTDDVNFSVLPELKQRVCFVKANIIELDDLPINNMDVIYCQNVLVYFKSWRQKIVLDELVKRLRPNGLLVLGMGEAVDWVNDKVERVQNDSVQTYLKVA